MRCQGSQSWLAPCSPHPQPCLTNVPPPPSHLQAGDALPGFAFLAGRAGDEGSQVEAALVGGQLVVATQHCAGTPDRAAWVHRHRGRSNH